MRNQFLGRIRSRFMFSNPKGYCRQCKNLRFSKMPIIVFKWRNSVYGQPSYARRCILASHPAALGLITSVSIVFRGKNIHVPEVNQQRWFEESGQRLENVDRIHRVQWITWLGGQWRTQQIWLVASKYYHKKSLMLMWSFKNPLNPSKLFHCVIYDVTSGRLSAQILIDPWRSFPLSWPFIFPPSTLNWPFNLRRLFAHTIGI